MEQALHEGDSWDFESKNVFIRLHCTWIQRRITDCKTLETSRLPTLRLLLCPLDAKITGAQSSPAFGFPAADLEGPLYSVPKYPVPFPSFPEAFLFPKPAEFSSFTFQLFLTFIFPVFPLWISVGWVRQIVKRFADFSRVFLPPSW